MTAITVVEKKTEALPFAQSRPKERVLIDIQAEAITSVIADGVKMTGDLEGTHGLKIDGHIRGSVVFGTNNGLCIVDQTGFIDGSLIGPRALIKGRIDGHVFIRGEVVLAPGAVVNGDVHYGRISLRDGAQINGRMYAITQKDAQPTQSTPTHRIDHVAPPEDPGPSMREEAAAA